MAKVRAKVILIIASSDAREQALALARRIQTEPDQSGVLVSCSKTEMDVVMEEASAGKTPER